MNFEFSEEQVMLRETVRRTLEDRWDIGTARRAAGADGTAAALWPHLDALGLRTMLVPEAHGGLGLTFLDLVLVIEEFGRALVPGAFLQTVLVSEVVARFATEPQKARILPRIAEHGAMAAVAWLEPEAEYGLDGIRMTATEAGAGWRLRGRKIMVPETEDAGVLLVAARLPSGTPALFAVDARDPAVRAARQGVMDPTARLLRLDFDDVAVSPDDLIGAGTDGGALRRFFDLGAAAAAAEMAGCAGRALDMAVAYAKQRQQFGQPIGAFQAIKHKCADMFVALETSRTAVYHAAWALAEDAAEAPSAVSMAKAYAGDACRLICNDSLQVHGGIGFTWDFDLHLYLKRGKLLEYSFGDAPWHRDRVIARWREGRAGAAGAAVAA